MVKNKYDTLDLYPCACGIFVFDSFMCVTNINTCILCLSILHYFCCRLMVPTNQTFTLCSILEKEKLNGRDSRHLLYTQFLRKNYFTNYVDWIHNLRIVLRAERKGEILDTPFLEAPTDNTSTIEKNAYKRACDADCRRLDSSSRHKRV